MRRPIFVLALLIGCGAAPLVHEVPEDDAEADATIDGGAGGATPVGFDGGLDADLPPSDASSTTPPELLDGGHGGPAEDAGTACKSCDGGA